MNHGRRELMRLIDQMEGRPECVRAEDFAALPVRLMIRITASRILHGLIRKFRKTK